MDFFGLFLGIFGRLFFGGDLGPAPTLAGPVPTKESATIDPDG